jgi:hypothetical protein
MVTHKLLAAVLFLILPVGLIWSQDWITAQSFYTHGQTGERVNQYAPIGPFFAQDQGNYVRSGYRHNRSSLQFGGSVDHYHTVEEWGRPIQPYDEWRFPNRPYSVPYSQWGPPYAGLGRGYGGYPFPFLGQPFPLPAFPIPNVQLPFIPGFGGQQPGLPYPGYRPWNDDRYPAFDDRAQWRHDPFPVVPP